MRDFAESLLDARERAVAQHHCQFSQGCNFQSHLDLIQRLAVGGVAEAQAVVGESAVLVGVGSNIDVAVVEIVVGKIPVSSAMVSWTT